MIADSKRGHVVWTRSLLDARADAYRRDRQELEPELELERFIGATRRDIIE